MQTVWLVYTLHTRHIELKTLEKVSGAVNVLLKSVISFVCNKNAIRDTRNFKFVESRKKN